MFKVQRLCQRIFIQKQTRRIIACGTSSLGLLFGLQRVVMATNMVDDNQSPVAQLESFGYRFVDGKLQDIETKGPFEFNVYEEKSKNQRRYERIGEIMNQYVYHLLEMEGQLTRLHIPLDASEDDGRGFIFHSEDALKCDRLMIIVHGSGVVRAGQWARRLIINHSLESGTQLPYIKKAMELGYGVIVLNSNQHYDEVNDLPIKYNRSPESHFNYVWREIVSKCKAGDIAIVAHSYGGEITVAGATSNRDLIDRTFAVAFTDSVHYSSSNDRKIKKWMSKHVCNWVGSQLPLDEKLSTRKGDCVRRSAGTPVHEETSWYAFGSVFKFFEEQWEERKQKKQNTKPAPPQKKTKSVEESEDDEEFEILEYPSSEGESEKAKKQKKKKTPPSKSGENQDQNQDNNQSNLQDQDDIQSSLQNEDSIQSNLQNQDDSQSNLHIQDDIKSNLHNQGDNQSSSMNNEANDGGIFYDAEKGESQTEQTPKEPENNVEDMSQDEDEVANGDQRIVVLKDDQAVIDDDGSEPMSQDGVKQQSESSPVVTKAEL
ncbi:FAM172 family protein homolog CG10038-like isoform X1 [Clytia hemisphaerica]|uniref:FAM172 family protein homolog CG10038-like isoform X1 n=1 Tax=Clytia hemisphaerica TaxID=252671 RepID=UPI0034D534D8